MSEWKARRFWSSVAVHSEDGGWTVLLDERPLRTPGKRPLHLPTKALALAVADEWQAVQDEIQPNRMPLTRASNSAIEKVVPQFHGIVSMLAEYGDTDLLAYRADKPEELLRAQAEGWDPLIDWAATELRAPLRITHGVIPVPQDPEVLLKLRADVAALDPFGLMALHDLVTLPGSLILGLAVIRRRIDAETAHSLSRIDEEFQAQNWGRDAEADEAAAARLAAMRESERLWLLSRG
ncbi:ATP12 family protein [Paracoccus sp. (in: a-proteobacteria)]|uniref:ATP12 family chaperone protein n=1 Tax=Paracoccus sp. TaxID=267 RepID=UPI0028A87159|nr:ATP12 family protein [Paracoccus sp. (in: a-proteobacteria)]